MDLGVMGVSGSIAVARDIGAFTVILLNFAYIALLPLIFFRRDGEKNARWWLNTAPFLLSIGSVTAAQFGVLPVAFSGSSLTTVAAVAASIASLSLISFTLGTHRIPLSLWHQSNDAPREIVTWGAYQYIRHPFYSSFILTFLAALIYSPQVFTLASCLIGLLLLNWTAASEERKLLDSHLGSEYRSYMSHTGRFIPIAR